MPRAVPPDVARRRRDRLSELVDALGAARGQRLTQREFAASLGREQGTVAAILGGHRALGGDVMMAVIQAYRLSSDYFDSPLRPDPKPYARAAMGEVARDAGSVARAMPAAAPAMPVNAPAIRSVARENPGASSDPVLAEVIATFQPTGAVAMALEAIARRGVRLDWEAWVRNAIGAQSAHELGVLVSWYDSTLAALAESVTDEDRDGGANEVQDRSSTENVRFMPPRLR